MDKSIPVKAGGTYKVTISGLGHSGEGVGKYQDFTIFVPLALPGETVEVTVSQVKKNYAKGRLKRIVETAAHRAQPRCGIFAECGGCQLQHLDYQGQLAVKHRTVADAMARIAKLPEVVVHPTIGAADPWYYRNKMQFPVGRSGGKTVMGCYSLGTHNIIDTDECLIQHETNNVIVRQVRQVITSLGIAPYDEATGEGVIRHVLGRVGTASGEVMVVLVTATWELPHKDKIIDSLKRNIPGIVSIVQNVNRRKTNIILGDHTKTLWGRDTITDNLGDFTFHISALSFFQVNTAQAKVLYDKAVEYAGLTGGETVIDAYCGTGTITLFLAQRAAKVYGIEMVEPAVLDARRNAADNGVDNVEFIVGDAVEVMPRLFERGIRPHTVVVDPPRAGCEAKVLETFVSMQPRRIVYVSCNPASLARDLALLAQKGYQAKEVQPVDMFPHTYHVETVTLLQRKHD